MKRWFCEKILGIKSPTREWQKAIDTGTLDEALKTGVKEGFALAKEYKSPTFRVDLTQSNLRWLAVKTRLPETALQIVLNDSILRRVQTFFEFTEGQLGYSVYFEDSCEE